MSKKTKFFSDFSKIATDTFGTFAGVKKEIETIVKIRIERFINKADLVKREEFEVLKLLVEKITKKNRELEKLVKPSKSKRRLKIKKNK